MTKHSNKYLKHKLPKFLTASSMTDWKHLDLDCLQATTAGTTGLGVNLIVDNHFTFP